MKNLFNQLAPVFLITSLSMSTALAAPVQTVAVNKASCQKLANTTHPFVLVLDSGDDLIPSISQCARDAKLKGAMISGLGQVQNPTLAYFSSDPKAKPTLTNFAGFYELASLNGNITNNAGQHYTHVHAVLADKQFHGIAGHVNDAKVGLTVEVTIIPFTSAVERMVDAETGFGSIVH